MRFPIDKKRYLVYLSVLVLFFFTACSGGGSKTPKVTPGKEPDYIFYPPLPDTPRYQYLTTFSSSLDIQKKQSKFFKFVAGDEQEKPKVIKKPYGVDIYDGVIYVCDIRSRGVITLNLKTREFGYMGVRGSGKLGRPVNLKIDKQEKIIYVADMGRQQVVCFNLEGKAVRFYGKRGQFNPSDVDFHGSKLYISDVKNHRIHVLDKDSGEVIQTIGKPGSNDGDLFHPTNITIKHDRLYVSDTTNFRIQVFDLEGNFLEKFGEIGRRPGNFSRNKGIDVDNEGRIYVVDAAFENVQVFNKEFKLRIWMFGPGIEKHNINLPAVITIDYDNMEYFRKYLSPKFKAEYLLFVTSNFGLNKVNVYAFGKYQK